MGDTPSTEVLRRSLDTFLAKDMRAWADLCDQDVVVEFPFAPEGSPRRLDGRAAIYEYLRNYPDMIDVRERTSLHIYSTGDPGVAIAEWSVSGVVLANGNDYDMTYATFVTVRNGLIQSYREYWNPQAFMAAMGGRGF